MGILKTEYLYYFILVLIGMTCLALLGLWGWHSFQKRRKQKMVLEKQACLEKLKLIEKNAFISQDLILKLEKNYSKILIEECLFELLEHNHIKNKKFFKSLIQYLGIIEKETKKLQESPHVKVRAHAAFCLGFIDSSQNIIKTLIEVIEDPDEEDIVKLQCKDALKKFTDEPHYFIECLTHCSQSLRPLLIDLIVSSGKDILFFVQTKYRNEKNKVLKVLYAQILAKFHDKTYLYEFREKALIEDPLTQMSYLKILEELQDKEFGGDLLIYLLDHLDTPQSQQVACILGELAAEVQLLKLHMWLKDPDYWTRLKVVKILPYLGRKAEPFLLEALFDSNNEIVYRATLGLKKLCYIERHVRYLGPSNKNETRDLKKIFMQLGKQGYIEPLLNALDQDISFNIKRQICDILGEIQNPIALESLGHLISNQSWSVRASAALALGNIQDPKILHYLISLISDSEETVREMALRSISKVRSSMLYDFIDEFIILLQDNHYPIRISAIKILRSIKKKESLNALLKKIHDPILHVRAAIAEALGYFDTVPSVSGLIELLGDKSPKIKKITLESLQNIYHTTHNEEIKKYIENHKMELLSQTKKAA